MDKVFNEDELNKQVLKLRANPPKHYISVIYGNTKEPDFNDQHAYCLCREIDGHVEVLLNDVMIDYNVFEETVNNLSEYFKAEKLIFKYD